MKVQLVKEASRLYPSRRIGSPIDVVNLVKELIEREDREKFLAIYLNMKNEPEAIHTVSIGTLNASLCHPREVYKGAILANAASIIAVHNHPCGDPSCSKEDIAITKRLQEAGKILGIELIDHIVIGSDGRYESLKEKGII